MHWVDGNNWYDQTTGRYDGAPRVGDSATIPAGYSVVLDQGNNASIGTLTLNRGSGLIVSGATDNNPKSILELDNGTLNGAVTDSGEIISNREVDFYGGAHIGPGDSHGNLAGAGIFLFATPPDGSTNVFLSGATIGDSGGQVNGPDVQFGDTSIAQPGDVTIDGPITNYSGIIENDGTLEGMGAIDNFGSFYWLSGLISLEGRLTNEHGAFFNAQPSVNNLTLETVLYNDGGQMQFIGPFNLHAINGGGVFNTDGGEVEMAGIVVDDPDADGNGIYNDDGCSLIFAPDIDGAGNLVECTFTSIGDLQVDPDGGEGPCLTINNVDIELDESIDAQGTCIVQGQVDSTTGFTNEADSGVLIIQAVVTVFGDTIDNLGNMQVSGAGSIEGAGGGGDAQNVFINEGNLALLDSGEIKNMDYFTQTASGTLVQDQHNGMIGFNTITNVANVLLDGAFEFVNGPPNQGIAHVVSNCGTINGEFAELPANTIETNTDHDVYVTVVGSGSGSGGAQRRGIAMPPGPLYLSQGSLSLTTGTGQIEEPVAGAMITRPV